MLKYFKYSDISCRVALNPFGWKWIPAVAYEGPTPFYPKRRTFAFAFLFLQTFLDIDDGTTDVETFNKLFMGAIDAYDESNVGHKISKISETHSSLE